MPKPYGINGTPWHVERVHNNDPDDTRRHRSRCVFYDPVAKYCSKQVGDCYGAAHCKYYQEGRRDLITTDTATFETVQYERVSNTFIPERAKDGTAENQIRIGDMVQRSSGRYMIVDAEMDENRHHVYSCVQAKEIQNKSDAQGLIYIYGNWYLTNKEINKCHATEFGVVQHLPQSVVNHVKSERDRQLAREKLVGQKQGTGNKKIGLSDGYVFSPYFGKFSKPSGTQVEKMILEVRGKGDRWVKELHVRVDKRNRVIFIERSLYDIHREQLMNCDSLELLNK